jgi:hypothetical protein
MNLIGRPCAFWDVYRVNKDSPLEVRVATRHNGGAGEPRLGTDLGQAPGQTPRMVSIDSVQDFDLQLSLSTRFFLWGDLPIDV